MSTVGNQFIAGILDRLPEISCFLNADTNSYNRLNQIKMDNSIPSIIRVQPEDSSTNSVALCSPDAMCNIYIALNLILHAGVEGIELKKDINNVCCNKFSDLPSSLEEALNIAENSQFVKSIIGEEAWKNFKFSLDEIIDLYNSAEDKCAFEDTMYMNYYG
jgi:glutamine synthetase